MQGARYPACIALRAMSTSSLPRARAIEVFFVIAPVILTLGYWAVSFHP